MLRKSLLLILLLFSASSAFAGWATDKDLNDNELRSQAWYAYRQGLSETDATRAIDHWLTARARWPLEGKLEIYKVVSRRQGVRIRYQLRDRQTHKYVPSQKIFRAYEAILAKARAQAAALAKPRSKAAVEGQLKVVLGLLERFETHKLNPLRVRSERAELRSLVAELTRIEKPKPPVVKPPKPVEKPKPKDPVAPTAPKEDPEDKAERLKVARLRFELLVDRLKRINAEGERLLGEGEVVAAEALIGSSTLVLSKIEALPEEIDDLRASVATVVSKSLRLGRLTRGMGALLALDFEKVRGEAEREVFRRGLKAAEEVNAVLWSQVQQQRAAMRLIQAGRLGQARRSDLRAWSKVLGDPVAREAIRAWLDDDTYNDAAECEDWPFPDKQKKGYVDQYAVALSVRALALAEECWQQRSVEGTAERRRELLNSLERTLAALLKAATLKDLKAPAKVLLGRATERLREELVGVVFCLFQDRGMAAVRLGGYLAALPELSQLLGSSRYARVLMAIGLGGLAKTGNEALLWLVDEALKRDGRVIDQLPGQVPAWLVQKAKERKINQGGD